MLQYSSPRKVGTTSFSCLWASLSGSLLTNRMEPKGRFMTSEVHLEETLQPGLAVAWATCPWNPDAVLGQSPSHGGHTGCLCTAPAELLAPARTLGVTQPSHILPPTPGSPSGG